MSAIKQAVIAEIARLPDNVDIGTIIEALEKLRENTRRQAIDACFGTLGSRRRTDAVIAELRDEP